MVRRSQLAGWMPIRVAWEGGEPKVEWILLGDRRFTEPFFEDTIQGLLRHPFHHAFRKTTGIDALEGHGLPAAGFIFHMSRCGSTLLCQSLAAVERNIVLSEPPPVDSILRAHLRNPEFTASHRADGVRSMLNVLGRKRHPAEERIFVKFDCWNIAELPVVRQAFPGVPWIFVYRDPLEVLVSQLRQRAQWSVPGGLSPAVLGLSESPEMPHDEYCARMLGRICEIALQQFRGSPGGLLVNYTQLPGFYVSGLVRHFKLDVRDGEDELMRQVAGFNAKDPRLPFEPDSNAKRNDATDRMRDLAAHWITPFYEELEMERCRQ